MGTVSSRRRQSCRGRQRQNFSGPEGETTRHSRNRSSGQAHDSHQSAIRLNNSFDSFDHSGHWGNLSDAACASNFDYRNLQTRFARLNTEEAQNDENLMLEQALLSSAESSQHLLSRSRVRTTSAHSRHLQNQPLEQDAVLATRQVQRRQETLPIVRVFSGFYRAGRCIDHVFRVFFAVIPVLYLGIAFLSGIVSVFRFFMPRHNHRRRHR